MKRLLSRSFAAAGLSAGSNGISVLEGAAGVAHTGFTHVQLQWAALCVAGWRGAAAATAAAAKPESLDVQSSSQSSPPDRADTGADGRQWQRHTNPKHHAPEAAVVRTSKSELGSSSGGGGKARSKASSRQGSLESANTSHSNGQSSSGSSSSSSRQSAAISSNPKRPVASGSSTSSTSEGSSSRSPASKPSAAPTANSSSSSSSSKQSAANSDHGSTTSPTSSNSMQAATPLAGKSSTPTKSSAAAARTARRDRGQAIAVLNESLNRMRAAWNRARQMPEEASDISLQLANKTFVPFMRHTRANLTPQLVTELVHHLLPTKRANLPDAGPATGGQDSSSSPIPHPQTADARVMELYLAYVRTHYADQVHQRPRQDLSQPHQWFPFARAIHRKIIYHAGPTNSGKTHTAVQALKAAQAGVYCSPLRLLALEQYDRLNQDGVRCNLTTGEEVREVPGASHVSCTIEMANINKRWDVAVIDEIQMIGDEHRGSAWTRALLGLPACEVHVCGDDTALELVRRVCEDTGEDLEVKRYERATALCTEDKPLHHVQDVQAGDCIVTFSRRDIYNYKKAIEASTKHKVCVVYGALPAETRRLQARLFNTPGTGYDVLVATDAVGMGLNLNIRRVIFLSLDRPTGIPWDPREPLTDSAIKQIAGRAGRRSSDFPEGRVTTVNASDLHRVKSALASSLSSLKLLKLYPEPEQIERLATTMPGAPFEAVLARFQASEVLLGRHHELCNVTTMVKIAEVLEPITNLNVADRLRICMAPVPKGRVELMSLLFHFASQYAAGVLVPPPRPMENRKRAALLKLLRQGVLSTVKGLPPKSIQDAVLTMNELEECHQMLTLWLWLSYRLDKEDQLVGRSIAMSELADVQYGLARLLELITGTQLAYQLDGHDKRGQKSGRTAEAPAGRGVFGRVVTPSKEQGKRKQGGKVAQAAAG